MLTEEDRVDPVVPEGDGLPAEIDLGRHRDLEGRAAGQWLRRGFLALLVLLLAAALANVFGQAAATDTASGGGGTLSVRAPSRVRGGLSYQGEFVIHADTATAAPTLVLERGWVDQTTVNTIQPEPVGSTTDAAGDLKLRYPSIAAGRTSSSTSSSRPIRSTSAPTTPASRSTTGHGPSPPSPAPNSTSPDPPSSSSSRATSSNRA